MKKEYLVNLENYVNGRVNELLLKILHKLYICFQMLMEKE